MIMDYLTRTLAFQAPQPSLELHPVSKKMQLVARCFVNNIKMFWKGDNQAIDLLMEGF